MGFLSVIIAMAFIATFLVARHWHDWGKWHKVTSGSDVLERTCEGCGLTERRTIRTTIYTRAVR